MISLIVWTQKVQHNYLMDRPTIKFTSRTPKRYNNKIQQEILMRCLPSSQKTISSPHNESKITYVLHYL